MAAPSQAIAWLQNPGDRAEDFSERVRQLRQDSKSKTMADNWENVFRMCAVFEVIARQLYYRYILHIMQLHKPTLYTTTFKLLAHSYTTIYNYSHHYYV